jgi:hypothetical protein
MKKLSVVVLLLIGAVVVLGASRDVPPTLLRSDAPALEISTSILPVTQDRYQLLARPRPGMYRCTALVHDQPGSNRVLAVPDIVIGPGESGEQTAVFGALEIRFRAKISATLDRADTDVTVTRTGQVINRQKSTVWLERAR